MSRIILARHGDTARTRGTLHGYSDEPLSSKGRQASYELARELAHYKPSMIYTSPIKRAKETAQILSDELNIPVEEAQELGPWNNGYLQGKDPKEYMDDIRYFVNNTHETPADGESIDDMAQRWLPSFESVYRNNKPDTIIDVTHGRNILLAKGYVDKGNLAPDFDHKAITDNDSTTDHSGYAVATPPNGFKIVSPKRVPHGRS